jgi:hypothetical protein
VSVSIDAGYHGLDYGLVLALLSIDPDNAKHVKGTQGQINLWLAANYAFPNLLGNSSDLITAYQNAPVTVQSDYDPMKVGVFNAGNTLVAELINLAIPE